MTPEQRERLHDLALWHLKRGAAHTREAARTPTGERETHEGEAAHHRHAARLLADVLGPKE